MCGIFGYTGEKNAAPLLLDGLRALEYRGYDSAGIFVAGGEMCKAVGPVEALAKKLSGNLGGSTGISHTRWATHGLPTERNAHPHHDCKGEIWLVHNGIIENYKELKEKLSHKGHTFSSDTDSEVLAHCIEENIKNGDPLEHAITTALKSVRGTYGIAVISKREPEKIVVARMGSPLVLGLGEGENFVASDAAAILRHTKTVVYLHDGDVATLTPSGHRVFSVDHEVRERAQDLIEWDVEEARKGGHPHFMLKEIMEIPEVLENSARGRILLDDGTAKLGGLSSVTDELKKLKRLIIVACGSAYYAGLVGKYMLEEYANIPVEVDIGSEFRYRNARLDRGTALLSISQSGETADTLASIREAKRQGLPTLGIVNVVGSTIARETDAGVYNHAGPEIGVASTKAFVSQLEVLMLLTLFLGRQRGLSSTAGEEIARELLALPGKARSILARRQDIERLAQDYASFENMLYIGRKYNMPIALEGALKLKEVSYIHAEGHGAGEMKHGPIAMIDEGFPTVAIVPSDSVYEKTVSNISEIRARRGRVLAVAAEGNEEIADLADDVMYIPKTLEMLSPILTVIPLQLFAYYVGVARGFDVDKPRNLAKSVTVE